MFELKILTDLSLMPKVVETNIDEVTPAIEAAIAKTKGLEVTDNKDEIIAADADASKLRKMCDAIKRFRIDHIKLWKEPMEAFESKCKDAEKRLTEAAAEIAGKTAEVKELWRERKRKQCEEVWRSKLTEAFGEGTDIVACNSVKAFFIHWTDPKTKGTWCNSGVPMSSVEKDMDAEIVRMRQTMEAVEQNYADQPPEILAKARLAMLVKFDMNDVITAVNAWKKEQADIAARAEAERQRKAEADAKMEAAKRELAERREREAAENAAKTESAASAAAPAIHAPEAAPKPSSGAEGGNLETYRLAITGTRENLIKLREFGVSLGIKFVNIDNQEAK